MALEVREDKEAWERTRWTWENSGSGSCRKEESGRITEEWVTELRHLPCIVTDHTGGREDNREQEGKDRIESNMWQEDRIGDIRWQEDSIIYNLEDIYSSIGGRHKHVDANHIRKIPIIVESEAHDDEMEDYYENHKVWPARSP